MQDTLGRLQDGFQHGAVERSARGQARGRHRSPDVRWAQLETLGKHIDVAGRQDVLAAQVLDPRAPSLPSGEVAHLDDKGESPQERPVQPVDAVRNPDGRHRVGLQQQVEPLLGHHAPVGALVRVSSSDPGKRIVVEKILQLVEHQQATTIAEQLVSQQQRRQALARCG